jgi:hypothetical protein
MSAPFLHPSFLSPRLRRHVSRNLPRQLCLPSLRAHLASDLTSSGWTPPPRPSSTSRFRRLLGRPYRAFLLVRTCRGCIMPRSESGSPGGRTTPPTGRHVSGMGIVFTRNHPGFHMNCAPCACAVHSSYKITAQCRHIMWIHPPEHILTAQSAIYRTPGFTDECLCVCFMRLRKLGYSSTRMFVWGLLPWCLWIQDNKACALTVHYTKRHANRAHPLLKRGQRQAVSATI